MARYLTDRFNDTGAYKIIQWFGQNGDSTHERFTQIPLGINTYEMADSLNMVLHGQGSVVERKRGSDESTSCQQQHADSHEASHSASASASIESFTWHSVGDWDDHKLVLANFDVSTK